MWFAKLFGGRQEDDSEPSAFPPHPASTPKVAPVTARLPASSQPITAKTAKPRKGFDPYNSGSFDKNKAWEKLVR